MTEQVEYRTCKASALTTIDHSALLKWLHPFQNILNEHGFTLPIEAKSPIKYGQLASVIKTFLKMNEKTSDPSVKEFLESLKVIEKLCTQELQFEVLFELRREVMCAPQYKTLDPLDAAVRLWVKDKSEANRIHDGRCEKETFTFCEEAFLILEFATEDGRLEWPMECPVGAYNECWVSEIFRKLENAFDSAFYNVTPTEDTANCMAIQQDRDRKIEERQTRLAKALWECDPEIARRYADVLRNVPKPLGLSRVERRAAFLEEIDRGERMFVQFRCGFTIIICPLLLEQPLKIPARLKDRALEILFRNWQEGNLFRDWDEVKAAAGITGAETDPYRFFSDRSKNHPEYDDVFHKLIERRKNAAGGGIEKVEVRFNPGFHYSVAL